MRTYTCNACGSVSDDGTPLTIAVTGLVTTLAHLPFYAGHPPQLDFCRAACFWAWVQAQQSPEPVALDTLED